MARYRKFHSKYSLEKKHQTLTNGDVLWEKDWSTVRGPIVGNFGANSKRKYTDGNFTFITSNIPTPEKKHTISNEGEVYTYDQVSDTVRTDTINNKLPEYNSDDLRTYAYFGSAYELVRTSIENIVTNFPPKLYTSHSYLDIVPLPGDYEHDIEHAVNSKKKPYYVLNNPFNVDFLTQHPVLEDGENPLRYMSVSYPSYKVVTYKNGKPDCEYSIDSYEIELVGNKINCFEETYNVYFHMPNGEVRTISETITSQNTYEQIEAGAITKNITAPSVNNLEYWVKSDKKDETTHSSADKYGTGFNNIELYSDNGVHFYPVMFQSVTYNVYFHNSDGSLAKTATKTITDQNEYNQIISGGKNLSISSSDIPSITNLVFWVLESKRNATSFTASDKHTSFDYRLDNNIHYYPFVFNAITYNVYFHKNDTNGTLLKQATKKITSYDDYLKVEAGTLSLNLTSSDIPSVSGLEFWVLKSKRNATSFTASDKHTSFNYQNDNNVHYYAYVFNAVTYAVYFHNSDGSLNENWTQKYEVTTRAELNQIVSKTKTLPASTLPTVNKLLYWVKKGKENEESHDDSDKYGTGFNSIDLFVDNSTHFYPIIEKDTIIPMDDLLNSSSINIVGFTDVVAPFTDSNTAFATWVPDVDEFSVSQYVLDFENTKSNESYVNLYDRTITDNSPAPNADYSTPYWSSKTDYDNNTSPTGYINYIKTTRTNKVFACFWIVSQEVAYPHKDMGRSWGSIDAEGFDGSIPNSTFTTKDKSYYDKAIQIEHCPKCSLFETINTTHPIYLEALIRSNVSAGFYPSLEENNGLFHWHQAAFYYDGIEYYHLVQGTGTGVYDICVTEDSRKDLNRGLLTLFVHKDDMETITNATTSNGQTILTRVNDKGKTNGSVWYCCIVTPNYDNPAVMTYLNNFNSEEIRCVRNLSYSDATRLYTFKIKIGDNDTYTYTCDKTTLDTFGVIGENGVFKITSPSNIPTSAIYKITTDDIYIPKSDKDSSNPRKFTKYNSINIVQYSGIEFIKKTN